MDNETPGIEVSREYVAAAQPEVMRNQEEGLTAVVGDRYEIKCVSVAPLDVSEVDKQLFGDQKNVWFIKVLDLKVPPEDNERVILNYGFAKDIELYNTDAALIHMDVVKYVEAQIKSGAGVDEEGLKVEIGEAMNRGSHVINKDQV